MMGVKDVKIRDLETENRALKRALLSTMNKLSKVPENDKFMQICFDSNFEFLKDQAGRQQSALAV